jgi:hypothetical protein
VSKKHVHKHERQRQLKERRAAKTVKKEAKRNARAR